MGVIQKVSVALTSDQLASLKAVVDAGEYATTSEIVNATTTATAGKPTRRAIRRRLLMAGLLFRERQ